MAFITCGNYVVKDQQQVIPYEWLSQDSNPVLWDSQALFFFSLPHNHSVWSFQGLIDLSPQSNLVEVDQSEWKGTKHLNLVPILGLCRGQVPSTSVREEMPGWCGRGEMSSSKIPNGKDIYPGGFRHTNGQNKGLDRLASQPQHALLWF